MLILASASPRRAELLRNAGIAFTAIPASIPEERRAGEDPVSYARRLAAEKARAVARQHPNDTILGADTIVVVGGEVLEKPRDAEDARSMLRRLSGRTHEVTTGVCLMSNGKERVESETTRVKMTQISVAEVDFYIATGEPMDKAGAYAIQGIASRWIPRIEGCYFNVVGLPVPLVYRILRESKLI